jgi:hypothetical protein
MDLMDLGSSVEYGEFSSKHTKSSGAANSRGESEQYTVLNGDANLPEGSNGL